MKPALAAIATVCLLFASVSAAQWELSNYQTNKSSTLDGYLIKVDMSDPGRGRMASCGRVMLHLYVKDSSGKKSVVWEIHHDQSAQLCDVVDKLKIGDKLRVTGYPARVSAPAPNAAKKELTPEEERRQAGRLLYCTQFTLPDGRQIKIP